MRNHQTVDSPLIQQKAFVPAGLSPRQGSLRTRLSLAFLLACPFLWVNSGAADQPAGNELPANIDAMAQRIGDLVVAKPTFSEELLHPSIRSKLPTSQLESILATVYQQHGAVKAVRLQSREPQKSIYRLIFANVAMPLTLAVSPNPPVQILGIFFAPPVALNQDLGKVLQELEQLPGQVSFRVEELAPEPKVLRELNPDLQLAIGSTFKLWILAALAEREDPWAEVLRLRPEHKSLPSGNLHKWPDGAPFTLHSLAALMISRSDNTATDHLLFEVGRQRVEAMLAKTGHSSPERTLPFLGTLEMFKLKSDAELLARYIQADQAGRRQMLAGAVAAMPRDKVTGPIGPTAVAEVEWFASAKDVCRLLDWYEQRQDPILFGLLSLNPGLQIPSERFNYAGFKGGSEPGVVSLSLLLHTTDGRALALTGTWNNPETEVDEAKFVGLMQSVLDLL